MMKNILISGASIAGLTTAYWLSQNGFNITIVERHDSLRLGGQNIDISDAAINVVEKMGLLDKIKKQHTGEEGLQFVDTNNTPKASFPVGQKGSMTREVEILRGDLVEILAKALPDTVDFKFNTMISDVQNKADSVFVEFQNGEKIEYDAVIAADGMNSSTRPIIGAYILAHEMIAHNDHGPAFQAYEDKFRPFVESEQKLPPGVPDMAYAKSQLKVNLINAGAGIAASKPVQKFFALFNKEEDVIKFELPDYQKSSAT